MASGGRNNWLSFPALPLTREQQLLELMQAVSGSTSMSSHIYIYCVYVPRILAIIIMRNFEIALHNFEIALHNL